MLEKQETIMAQHLQIQPEYKSEFQITSAKGVYRVDKPTGLQVDNLNPSDGSFVTSVNIDSRLMAIDISWQNNATYQLKIVNPTMQL